MGDQFYFGGYDKKHGGFRVLRDYRGESKQGHPIAHFVQESDALQYISYANSQNDKHGDRVDWWDK